MPFDYRNWLSAGVASLCLFCSPATPVAATTPAKPATAKPATGPTDRPADKPADKAPAKPSTPPTSAGKPTHTSTPEESLGRYLAADLLEAAHGLMSEWTTEKNNYLKNRPDKDTAWVTATEQKLAAKKAELLEFSNKLRRDGITGQELQTLSSSAQQSMEDAMNTLLIVRVRAIPKAELSDFSRGFDEIGPKLTARWSDAVAYYRKNGSDMPWMDKVESEAKQNLGVMDTSMKSANTMLKAGDDKGARGELEKAAISVMWLQTNLSGVESKSKLETLGKKPPEASPAAATPAAAK